MIRAVYVGSLTIVRILAVIVALTVPVVAVGGPGTPAASLQTRAPAESDIHAAARAGDVATLQALVRADASRLNARDANGMTPLMHAAREKHPAAAAWLLEARADVHAADANRYTALHHAAFVGEPATTAALLKAGGSLIAVESMGRTPLALACGFGHDLETVRLLVAAGADVNATPPSGENILAGTVAFGRPEILDFLIERGARLPRDQRAIWMALNASASRGLDRVFRMAVEAATTMGMRWPQAVSLHVAAAGGSLTIVTELLEQGANAADKNAYGSTALHVAAAAGKTACASLLIERGAVVDERDAMGRTPWNLATDGGHAETAALLAARGAVREPARFPDLRGNWLGQPEPGDEPRVFAPGIVSGFALGSEHSPVTFSPDGHDVFWTQAFRGPVMYSRRVNGLWTPPKPAPFMSTYGEGEPIFTPDGRRLYFLSWRPLAPGGRSDKENIWFVDRAGDGWSEARPVSEVVNAFEHHWLFSVAADGTLWFSSTRDGGSGGRDLYYAPMEHGVHQAPRHAGGVLNSAGDEHMPYIAPDGSYLLFVSRGREGGESDFRFYISYRSAGGAWTPPLRVGGKIETIQQALCPLVTPDGRFMSFLGRGDIYWVKADFIEALRPKQPPVRPAPH